MNLIQQTRTPQKMQIVAKIHSKLMKEIQMFFSHDPTHSSNRYYTLVTCVLDSNNYYSFAHSMRIALRIKKQTGIYRRYSIWAKGSHQYINKALAQVQWHCHNMDTKCYGNWYQEQHHSCWNCSSPLAFEALFQVKPNYSYLKVFGCLAFATTLVNGKYKLDPKFREYVFIGYPFRIKGIDY